MSARGTDEHITLEAAEWLLRLDENCGPECRSEFLAWLKRSPRHMDEFLMVEAAYRTLHQFDPQRRAEIDALVENASAEIVQLRGNSAAPTAGAARDSRSRVMRRSWLRRPLTMVAAATILIIVGLLVLAPLIFQTRIYATDIGEQRAFKLADGSLLHLNTLSRAEIRFSKGARDVRLLQGEALFIVRPDASRPFRVSTDTAVVQAVGTAFNVYLRADDSTLVSVVEGRVKVADRGPTGSSMTGLERLAVATPLSAGEEANVLDGEIVKRAAPDIAQTIAWRQRRLVFRETTLGEVVAQFNRYNADVQLQVQGDAIAQRRITGTFDADEPQALLKFLERDPGIQLAPEADAMVIRPSSSSLPSGRGPG